jgi:hypothetical protein
MTANEARRNGESVLEGLTRLVPERRKGDLIWRRVHREGIAAVIGGEKPARSDGESLLKQENRK